MMKLDGVAAFVMVAEAGSITAAAQRMGLAKSVVSERLAELERLVGTRLVQRTTRKLSLTEGGTAFLERGRRLLREAEEAVAELAERRSELVGPLRISGPVSFGVLHLGPAIFSFLATNPKIELALELEDRFVDAAADGYDAVIRHGPIHDTRLVARHIASSRRVLVASPAYLDACGRPGTLIELRQHRAILYMNRDSDWRFHSESGAVVVRAQPAVRVNNGLMMRDAALAGLGITLLPTFVVHEQVARGDLQIVDVGIEAEGAEVHVAHPRDRAASVKVRSLTEHLRQSFGNPPYWETAVAQASPMS